MEYSQDSIFDFTCENVINFSTTNGNYILSITMICPPPMKMKMNQKHFESVQQLL